MIGAMGAAKEKLFGADPQKHAIIKAAENEFLERPSIAKLDCATNANGHIDLGSINQFMLDQITHTLADRFRGRREVKDSQTRRKWVEENISSIRCVVAQLDDGTYRSAVQAAGQFDPASPHPEAVIAAQVAPSMGRHGIRHVWVMEMNPSMIHEGKYMPTSPKEGIERLYKRASADGIDFTFIPINPWRSSAVELAIISPSFTKPKDIFPPLFKGSRPVEAGVSPKPESWTKFQQARQALAAAMTGI